MKSSAGKVAPNWKELLPCLGHQRVRGWKAKENSSNVQVAKHTNRVCSKPRPRGTILIQDTLLATPQDSLYRWLDQQGEAFGAPGMEPRWTSSVKDAVGTAYSPSSRIWFTASPAILNETSHPTIDHPHPPAT